RVGSARSTGRESARPGGRLDHSGDDTGRGRTDAPARARRRIAPEPAVAGERARAEELVRGSCRTGDAGGAWSSAGGRLGRLSGRDQGGAGGAWSSAGGRLGRLSGREQVTQAGRGAPPAGGWAARQGMGRPQRPRF